MLNLISFPAIDNCQRRFGRPQKHRHSCIDRKTSYPFHLICLVFLGPLPTSNGFRYILLIGDHFTKWYETIPFPDQTAATTSEALLERWSCRFGCPYNIHTDRGTNFESQLFGNLLKTLEIDKTRTTVFHPQSNCVNERMNKTLFKMPFSNASTGTRHSGLLNNHTFKWLIGRLFTNPPVPPLIFVIGHDFSLPLDKMYRSLPFAAPNDFHDWVL